MIFASIPHKSKLTQRGTTLVEMLITMGLLIIFLIITTTLFTATIDTGSESSSYNAVLSDGRFIMSRMNYDLVRATAISTPTSLGASSSSLAMTVDGSAYSVAISGTNLQLTDASGSANLNGDGSKISALTFQRLGNVGGKDTIRYSFTITSAAKGVKGPDQQILTSTVERR